MPAPTDGNPSVMDEAKTTSTTDPGSNQPAAPKPTATDTPTETQSQLASSDGAGIRGDYGDASQTNGLEGGEEQPTDAGPDRADHNPTNAPQQ